MSRPKFTFPGPTPLVVGSFGNSEALARETPESLALQCDLAEIRLDLLHEELAQEGENLWKHLNSFPILFTARCKAEGSPFDLSAEERSSLLRITLPTASLVDIEVASIPHMRKIIDEIEAEKIPWVASFHDFEHLPDLDELIAHASEAKSAGAAAFKVAAMFKKPEDLAELAHFQSLDLGIPLSTMGMGELAPVSRLLCAQTGSVLNYGYIGEITTAPGQWSARQLKEGVRSLTILS